MLMETKFMLKIEAEGRQAYFTGIEINPYTRDAEQFYAWERGWREGYEDDFMNEADFEEVTVGELEESSI